MCIVTRNIYGYLCKDEHNQFLYCCSNCNVEFDNGSDLQAHTFEHDADDKMDQSDSPEIDSATDDDDDDDDTSDECTLTEEAGTSSSSIGTVNQRTKNASTNTEEVTGSSESHKQPNQSKSTEEKSKSTKTITLRPSQAIRLKQKKGIPVSSIDRVFQCRICLAKFHKNCNLVRHMYIHIENRPTNECTICGKTVLDLKAHMRTHSVEKPHRCTLCPAAFRNSGSMHEHIRRHTDGSKQLICSFCEVVVFSNRDLTRHIAQCAESIPEDVLEDEIENEISKRIKVASTELRECVLCGTKVKNLKVHLRSHTHERPFECSICDRNFTQSGHRNLHMRQVHNIDPNSSPNEQLPVGKEHSCEKCCRNFDSMSDLDDHMRCQHIAPNGACKICAKIVAPGCITAHLRTHTGTNNQYKCSMCPTSFQRKDHLEEHLGQHTNVRPYECKFCKESTFTSAALKRHIKAKHPNEIAIDPKQPPAIERILCSVCGKTINAKNIEIHMRTHTGARPYKCTVCPAAFAQKSNLDNHARRHTGDRPYRCTPCDKSFHSACALNSHKRRHNSGGEPLKCDKCDSTFKTKRSLSNHRNVRHNGKRLHCCSLCSKTFGWESGLRDHMKLHNELKHQCKFCTAIFTTKSEQREHQRNEHHTP